MSGTADKGTELAAAHRSRDQRPGLSDCVDALEHDVRRRAQTPDLVGLGLAIHAPDLRAERLMATGLFDLIGDATTSSNCDAPWCTWEPSGMRSRTIRFASAAPTPGGR